MGSKKLLALWNSEVFAFKSNGVSIGTTSSGRISEVAGIGRCLLRAIPLYRCPSRLRIENTVVDVYFDMVETLVIRWNL